jgi:hypothetical protein
MVKIPVLKEVRSAQPRMYFEIDSPMCYSLWTWRGVIMPIAAG